MWAGRANIWIKGTVFYPCVVTLKIRQQIIERGVRGCSAAYPSGKGWDSAVWVGGDAGDGGDGGWAGVADVGGTAGHAVACEAVGIPGAPWVVAGVVVGIGAVDEACGIGGEEGGGVAVAVAVAFVAESAGFLPFAVGSVVAGGGAALVFGQAVRIVAAVQGHAAAGAELGGDVAPDVVIRVAGDAAGVLGVESAAHTATGVFDECCAREGALPFKGG